MIPTQPQKTWMDIPIFRRLRNGTAGNKPRRGRPAQKSKIRNIYDAYGYLYYRLVQHSTMLWNGKKGMGNMGGSNATALCMMINAVPIIIIMYESFGIKLIPEDKILVWICIIAIVICMEVFMYRKHDYFVARFRYENKKQRIRRGWFIMLYVALSVGFLIGTFTYYWEDKVQRTPKEMPHIDLGPEPIIRLQ